MNLEQIVKETVAKIVAEKQGKDLTGDGKIDSADYLKARSNAIDKAKGLDEDSMNDFGDVAGYIIDLVVDEGIITPEEAESDEVINNALEISEKMFGGYGASGQGISTSDYNRAARALVASLGKSLNEDHEDHEVSMAQSSLNSILRSAMELKAKIGNQEIDIPAWIQDHITNSENFIDQASQGYHEYSNGGEHGEMDDESGERRARVRFEDGTAKEVSINSLDESQLEEAMANKQNIAQIVAQKYGNQLAPVRDEYIASNEKWYQTISQYKANTPEFNEVNKEHSKIADGFKNMALNAAAKEMKAMGMSDTQIRNYFSEYGPFEDWVHDFMDELISELPQVSEQQNQNTMTTNEGRSAEDLKQGQLDQAYDHLEKIKEKPKLFSSEDIKKAEARIEKLEAELDALAAKATNESLDEATVRRWQHYAGIK